MFLVVHLGILGPRILEYLFAIKVTSPNPQQCQAKKQHAKRRHREWEEDKLPQMKLLEEEFGLRNFVKKLTFRDTESVVNVFENLRKETDDDDEEEDTAGNHPLPCYIRQVYIDTAHRGAIIATQVDQYLFLLSLPKEPKK